MLRQVGIYSLVYQSENKSLKYTILIMVMKLVNIWMSTPLFLYSDSEFEEFCLDIF